MYMSRSGGRQRGWWVFDLRLFSLHLRVHDVISIQSDSVWLSDSHFTVHTRSSELKWPSETSHKHYLGPLWPHKTNQSASDQEMIGTWFEINLVLAFCFSLNMMEANVANMLTAAAAISISSAAARIVVAGRMQTINISLIGWELRVTWLMLALLACKVAEG